MYANVFRKDMHVPAYANHFIYNTSGDFPQGIKRDFNVRSNAISTSERTSNNLKQNNIYKIVFGIILEYFLKNQIVYLYFE